MTRFRSGRHALRWVIASSIALLCHSGAAAEPRTLSIEDAVHAAWENDPTTQSIHHELRAAEFQAAAERLARGERHLDVGAGLMTMGDDMSPTWMLHASAGIDFVPRASREAKAAVAEHAGDTLRCAQHARALTLRERIESIASEQHFLRESVALYDEEQERYQQFKTLLQRWNAQGIPVTSALLQLESALSRAELAKLQIQAEQRTLEEELRRFIDLPHLDALNTHDAWFLQTIVPPEQRPAYDASTVQQNLEQQTRQLEAQALATERRIRWRIGASYDRSAMMTSPVDMVPSHIAMGTVGISIPNPRATNAQIQALHARRDAAETQQQNLQRQSTQQWNAQLQLLHNLTTELQLLNGQLVALNDILFREQERLMQRGQGDWSALLDAYRERNELQRAALERERNRTRVVIELDHRSDGLLSSRPPLLEACVTTLGEEDSQ